MTIFKNMKFPPLLLCFLALTSTSFGQTNIYYDQNDTKIELILTRCEIPTQGTDVTYFLIQVTNNSDKAIEISFDKQMWFDDKKQTFSPGENHISIQLEAKSSKTGTCDNSENKGMRIFQSMPEHLSKRILTQYELTNIQILELTQPVK